ncbi:putative Protein kinase domain-containing protein [Seiridium cardinale]|uniref:Protein kinase domain-containing protein n=1 Tax=Seiridium cardinale TaxID=138064 RepID=A0ABR2XEJ6_9PEZI
MAIQRAWTFRVQGLPLHVSTEKLASHLKGFIPPEERQDFRCDTFLVPACHPRQTTRVALVQFRPKPPAYLSHLVNDKTGMAEFHSHIDDWIISLDSGFFGLTQISDKPRKETELDIVFITGLDGHAYGSWTARQSGVTWPRDFLKVDLPQARVMTYGYNTKLSNAMLHTFDDFVTDFLSCIELDRDSDESINRPLVLVGHSYGARLITKALVKCKVLDRSAFHRGLLTSMKIIVFFGAPHRGIFTDDIEEYLNATSPDSKVSGARKSLVVELRPGNDAAERELQDFKDLLGDEVKAQIISVYERNPSRRLVGKNSPNSHNDVKTASAHANSWKRDGEPYAPLDNRSDLLGLPYSMEKRIPYDADHSNLTKFDARNLTYHLILRDLDRLCTALRASREGWSPKAQGLLAAQAVQRPISQTDSALGEAEPRRFPYDALYFPNNPELEQDRESPHWLDRVLQFFVNRRDLALKPRRFGVLEHDGQLEKVMVEFRPYPEDARLPEYLERQERFYSLAQLVLERSRQRSVVPLRGVANMSDSSTPCFLLIYRADRLVALDEAFGLLGMPTVKERIWLALKYAEAVEALHTREICHGLINPYNLYLQLPEAQGGGGSSTAKLHSLEATFPMLAGFDVARPSINGMMSDLLDVEDPDWRVYLHEDRLEPGPEKQRQQFEHDIFSLGMVLIVIGLWMPLSAFKKYHSYADERKRRKFCTRLRYDFESEDPEIGVPLAYQHVISYCLGKGTIYNENVLPIMNRVVVELVNLHGGLA